jgi:hypothetical protein
VKPDAAKGDPQLRDRAPAPEPRTGRVVEISPGMNHWDGKAWAPAVPEFVVSVDQSAFEAPRVQHFPRVAADLNVRGAIRLSIPGGGDLKNGRELQLTPAALVLYDATSGRSQVIAGITNCQGILVETNQVYFPEAFQAPGVCAGILLTVLPDSFEEDLVITGSLDAAQWGFFGDVRLQLWSESYGTEVPEREARLLRVERDEATRSRKASPDLSDETLWYGRELFIGQGQAYTLASPKDPAGLSVPVAKEFRTLTDDTGRTRSFIVESLELAPLADALKALPACEPAQKGGAALPRPTKSLFASIPQPPAVAKSKPRARGTLMAQARSGPAVVADYRVQLTTQTTLDSVTTYLVASQITLSSLIIEGGACVKLKQGASITVNGSITCKAGSGKPSVWTCVDDDSTGESMMNFTNSGYTGVINPAGYGSPCLQVNYSTASLINCVFRYAVHAVQAYPWASSTITFNFNHCQFYKCGRALNLSTGSTGWTVNANWNNCLLALVQYPLSASSVSSTINPTFLNCTLDQVGSLLTGGYYTPSLQATNCVFSWVTNAGNASCSGSYNAFYHASPKFGGNQFGSDSVFPFQTACLGGYYLSDASGYRGVGTTTRLPASLLADLKLRTTYPPVLMQETTISDPLVLTPLAQRNTGPIDLGFHYEPLDVVASNVTLAASLTLSNGVAIGFAGNYGFKLQSGANVTSTGLATALNRFTSVGNIQEQPQSAGAGKCFQLDSTLTGNFRFKFTDFAMPVGTSSGALLSAAANAYLQGELSFRDCRLRSATLNLAYASPASPVTIAFTNNLLERCEFTLSRQNAGPQITYTAFNNLFRGGNYSLNYSNAATGDPVWLVQDNLFYQANDTLTWSGANYVTSSTNGFTTGTTDRLQTAGAVLNLNADFVTGPLSDYYYPTSGTGLFRLVNAGDRTAASAGLDAYTMHVSLALEGTSIVDIGLHQAGVDSNGNPVDNDSDGLPDWWEWKYFGNLDQIGAMDYNQDGVSNLTEFQSGNDPNRLTFRAAFPGERFASNNIAGQVIMVGGVPSYAAVLVDSTNFSGAQWSMFSSIVTAGLGSTEGWHDVWVGLRGRTSDSEPSWRYRRLMLDLTPPQICITSPAGATSSQPVLQLAGFSPEPLASLRYDLTNSAGLQTNLSGLICQQIYDGVTRAVTSNFFQCFDIPLEPGANTVTLRARDIAGNLTTTNITFTYSTNTDVTPPAITLYWPTSGTRLAGTTFTWRGRLDDPTASVTAHVSNSQGTTAATGWVERTGHFWVENLPLAAGNNTLTLTATDVAGNSNTINIVVVQTAMVLTVADFSSQDLALGVADLNGSVGSPNYTVWVNGTRANDNGDGTWSASAVPLTWDGRVIVQARAIPNSDNGGNGSGTHGGTPTRENPGNPISTQAVDAEAALDQPFRAPYVESYTNFCLSIFYGYPSNWEGIINATLNLGWGDGKGGAQTNVDVFGPRIDNDVCTTAISWSATRWPELVDGTYTYACVQGGNSTGVMRPNIQLEHLDYDLTRWAPPGVSLGAWHEYIQRAHTVMRMQTGGRPETNRVALFWITASAFGILYDDWMPWLDDPWNGNVGPPITNIPPQYIEIGGFGPLDTNGNLYVVLPDGTNVDVTPRLVGPMSYINNYQFSMGASKYGLILTQPSGDPKDPPSDPNRLVFSDSTPGVQAPGYLVVELHASLTNNGPGYATTNHVRFDVDDIPGSTKTWHTNNPNGRPIANGSDLSATLYFTNLPPSNSAFGLTFARVFLDGAAVDQRCFWVFYTADAYNYPGSPTPPRLDEPSEQPAAFYIPPNYFYYYMQTKAAEGVSSACCESPRFDWRRSKTLTPKTARLPGTPAVPYWIESRDRRSGREIHAPGANGGQTLGYIDLFAWACRHEKRHHDNYHAWWPGNPPGYVASVDGVDGDMIPANLEPSLEGGPYRPDKFKTFEDDARDDDDERYTCITASPWTVRDRDPEDWACPGKNYP